MQGVIKSYDPGTGDGTIICDSDFRDYELARDALAGSAFRMLRQGQRVLFEIDPNGQATTLRLGSEIDMGTPGFHGAPEFSSTLSDDRATTSPPTEAT